MIKILTILLPIFCSSCQSWPVTAFDIANEPYHEIDNNCIHKANKFVLLEPDNEPELWVVRMPNKQGLHMKVKIAGWWIDPTNGTWERVLTIGVALYPYEE